MRLCSALPRSEGRYRGGSSSCRPGTFPRHGHVAASEAVARHRGDNPAGELQRVDRPPLPRRPRGERRRLSPLRLVRRRSSTAPDCKSTPRGSGIESCTRHHQNRILGRPPGAALGDPAARKGTRSGQAYRERGVAGAASNLPEREGGAGRGAAPTTDTYIDVILGAASNLTAHARNEAMARP